MVAASEQLRQVFTVVYLGNQRNTRGRRIEGHLQVDGHPSEIRREFLGQGTG
jgi:hypothetical protein